jgi:hypothetical protein
MNVEFAIVHIQISTIILPLSEHPSFSDSFLKVSLCYKMLHADSHTHRPGDVVVILG